MTTPVDLERLQEHKAMRETMDAACKIHDMTPYTQLEAEAAAARRIRMTAPKEEE